jgi:N-methylhydantoinase A/oxoprolinase/acetone carboxylase beta subunit
VKQHHANYDAASNERQRLHQAAGRLRGTCEDDTLVDDEIGRIPPTIALRDREEMATKFRGLARKRRDEHRQQTASRVESLVNRRVDMAGIGDPDDARVPVAEARRLLAEVQCAHAEPAAAAASIAQLSARVDEWSAATDRSIQEEKACRASPECMGGRAAKPVCEALERRKGWLADIARERRNPAGVVNLSYLNELGRNVQDTDEEIATKKRAYATAAKKPFTEAVCSRR